MKAQRQQGPRPQGRQGPGRIRRARWPTRSRCIEKFEEKLDRYPGNLPRAAVELAKDWRSDRVLRRLEALLVVADLEHSFLLSGAGELIEPDDGILAIGSGGNYALAAARALLPIRRSRPRDVVQRSLEIAADICVFTNRNITILEL